MGLDVYLYHCPDRKKAKAAEDKLQEFDDKQYAGKKYDDLTEAEKKKIRSKIKMKAVELGCTGEYSGHHTVTKIETDSTKHPEHMFKIGYFRSSYNDGGINRIMHNFGLPGLYEIFEHGDDYEFAPDWKKAKERVREAIEGYATQISMYGELHVLTVQSNIFAKDDVLPKDQSEALKIFKAEEDRKAKGGAFTKGVWTNKDGTFALEGMNVVAFIPGTNNILGEHPCTYVVYREEKKDDEANWYLQALEIVEETIDFVLSQPHPEQYYFHWSS